MKMKESNTETIAFEDGHQWTFASQVTRGLRKRFQKAALSIVSGGMDANGDIDMADPDALRRYAMAHPERLEVGKVEDAYLLYGTLSYSFGDEISTEFIDNLPEKYVNPVLERMKELYAEPSEEDSKKVTKTV